ncbi:MAG: 3'-5' exonuclease, partial [Parasphingopyxis sp.]
HAEEAGREFRDLSLARSYRSTPPILRLVDQVMSTLGPEVVGLVDDLEPHESGRGDGDLPGRVTLWDPVAPGGGDDIAEAEEGWLTDAALVYARKLAEQLRNWLSPDPDKRLWLAAKGRALRPEDVMILLRSRGELASLIVARLHQEGVPVAGVDRLLLTDPLAVQDLLAALRFALQPEDDLALANLLVSPLFGWSQDDLYALARGREASLWRTLRSRNDLNENTLPGVNEILNRADLVTPYRLLEHILSGPLDGRRKILARLGEEARDPIEELLNAALQFEGENPPSLQHFLDWFDRGVAEVTRDPSAPLDAVRVMTVHGAKGLQAPLVILADATRDPANVPPRSIRYAVEEDDAHKVPLPMPRKDERFGRLAEAAEAAARADREEHWRLLYVALTRAEEYLVVGGALGLRSKGEAPPESWYAVVAQAMEALGADGQDDPLWGRAHHYTGTGTAKPGSSRLRRKPPAIATPAWLRQAAPREARPPRPLAPSSIGPDAVADPPPGAAQRSAAERGVLLHRLFERLPELAPEDRPAAADRWLEQSGGIASSEERKALAEAALAVIDDQRFAKLFGPEALAEAPIAAVVDEIVIAGTVDRLLVAEEAVTVIDFKTGRRVPASLDAVPESHLEQMAGYAAALAVIFPDRPVRAGLLYTAGPELLMLPADLLAAHRPRPADSEQALSPIA